jgi:hypothetical protein
VARSSMNMTIFQEPGVSTLPGILTTFTSESPEMSTPRMVPAS